VPSVFRRINLLPCGSGSFRLHPPEAPNRERIVVCRLWIIDEAPQRLVVDACADPEMLSDRAILRTWQHPPRSFEVEHHLVTVRQH